MGYSVSDIDLTSTTWKIFVLQAEAQDYADVTWASLVQIAPIERIPEEFHDVKSRMPRDVREMTPDEIRTIAEVPLKGLDYEGNVVDAGYSGAWAIPRETADGQWAVPCLDKFDMGGPMPEWPVIPEEEFPDE